VPKWHNLKGGICSYKEKECDGKPKQTLKAKKQARFLGGRLYKLLLLIFAEVELL